MRALVENLGPRKREQLAQAWEKHKPHIDPTPWTDVTNYVQGRRWRSATSCLILTVEFVDGELWLHMSYSHADRCPTWEEMRDAKRLYMGHKLKAISVVPPTDEHYTHHDYCLHLFAPLGRDPLPDFRDPKGRL